MTKRNDDRARQRGKINHIFGAIFLLNPGHRVTQNEAAFRVGVDDLNRLARHRGHDVTGALCVPVRHILNKAANADDVRL